MVDHGPAGRRWGNLVAIDSSESLGDDRPCMRIGGCVDGDVTAFEFFKGGGDVVDVEHDGCRDPFVCVVLDDLKDIDLNRVNFAARGAKARENRGVRLALR